ncbi:MAG: DUF2905 domain-containing protein [Candidatus Aureabacteria bacterium]|nr:DUF2905 domain-containing protein [Candidatus Auribacterota bacterium]
MNRSLIEDGLTRLRSGTGYRMDDFQMLGRLLIAAGLLLSLIGGLFLLGDRVSWIGHLPGDVSVQRRHFRFYFPLGTCVLMSFILTLLLWLLRRR